MGDDVEAWCSLESVCKGCGVFTVKFRSMICKYVSITDETNPSVLRLTDKTDNTYGSRGNIPYTFRIWNGFPRVSDQVSIFTTTWMADFRVFNNVN
jgi:hypothetical protein